MVQRTKKKIEWKICRCTKVEW